MAKTIDQLTALGATPDDSDNLVIDDSGVTKKVTAAQLKGDCVRAEKNNALSSTVGTRIGTATNQLLGFWNAAPVDQPAVTADLLDSLQEVGLIASGAGDTPLNLSGGTLTCGSAVATGTAGVGYATGAGGTVTQATSRTTAVTIDKTCGSITMFSAAGSTTAATFTVNNSTVAANDVIILNERSGSNLYDLIVSAVAAGSFNITFRTTGGTATDAPVINFAVIKAVTA
jgi:hypothetical protein